MAEPNLPGYDAAQREWEDREPPHGPPPCPRCGLDVDDIQTDAYAEGRRDEQAELSSVLPGTTYMDPPDGGAPTILEQLQRQAKDARRYLWLRQRMYEAVIPHGNTLNGRRTAWIGKFVPLAGNGVDDAIDAAMLAARERT